MRSLLLPLLLSSALAAPGCSFKSGTLDAAKVLVKEQIPALVASLEQDAQARIKATEKLGDVLDWLDYILAGCAAGIIALVSTWGKTAARKWAERKKPTRRRSAK
jgi:hypothetical protein